MNSEKHLRHTLSEAKTLLNKIQTQQSSTAAAQEVLMLRIRDLERRLKQRTKEDPRERR